MLLLLVPLLVGCGREYVDADYWTMHTIESRLNGADGVDLFDIDGDGDIDALSSWEESAEVMLHENPGADNIREPWTGNRVSGGLTMRKVEDARYADFSGDGKVDAVVTATENHSEKVGIHWLTRAGRAFDEASWQGTWIAPEFKYLFVKVAIGQIDGRGARDIVVGSKGDAKQAQLLWYQAPADPSVNNAHEWQGHAVAVIDWTDSLEIVDINGDGDNDILLNHWDHLAWYENPGEFDTAAPPWDQHVISNTTKAYFARCDTGQGPAQALRLVVGADIATAEVGDTVAWLVSKELDVNGVWSGRWVQQRITSPDPIPRDPDQRDYQVKSMACGNIDDDPKPDIVVSISGYGHGVFALMNLADGPGEQSLRVQPIASARHNSRKGIKFDDVRLADLDLDGDLDIVTTEENGSYDNWWSTNGLGLVWYENP